MIEKDSRGCPGHALHVLSPFCFCACVSHNTGSWKKVYMCNFVLEMLFHPREWQRGVITISSRSKLHSTCPVRKRGLCSIEKGLASFVGTRQQPPYEEGIRRTETGSPGQCRAEQTGGVSSSHRQGIRRNSPPGGWPGSRAGAPESCAKGLLPREFSAPRWIMPRVICLEQEAGRDTSQGLIPSELPNESPIPSSGLTVILTGTHRRGQPAARPDPAGV